MMFDTITSTFWVYVTIAAIFITSNLLLTIPRPSK
jgi:hypothetical protein